MGKFLSRLVILGLSIYMFAGCATVIFDRYDKVDIVTEPAGVEIYDREGFNIGIAPVQIPFKRLPQQHLTLRMDDYVDTTTLMDRAEEQIEGGVHDLREARERLRLMAEQTLSLIHI